MKYYTGVGSRNTPPEILALMAKIGYALAQQGWILRSGGAEGADSAFERGVRDAGAAEKMEIYLPWRNFNGNSSQRFGVCNEARELAATVHPAWQHLSQAAQSLHARNCYQVLGENLATPSSFLVCWTPDGCVSAETRKKTTGGTATAIVLAERKGIPRFNLGRGGGLVALRRYIKEGVLPVYCQAQNELI